MHIQKNYIHWFAWVIIAIMMIKIIATPIVADASILTPTTNPVTAGKLIDMCLTRSGKVVNGDIREDVLTQARNVLNDTATSYRQWCKDNGKSKSVETFREYLESDAYASLPFRLAKWPLNLASFINWLIEGETLLDVIGTDVEDVLTEHDEKGNVSVPSETVNIINQCFDKVKGTYTSGWRYVDVQPSSELPSAWFGDQGSWQNVKDLIDSSDNPTYIFFNKNYPSYENVYHIVDNTQPLYTVEMHGGYSGGGLRSSFFFYKEDWTEYKKGVQFLTGVQQFDISKENIQEKLIDLTTSSCMWYKKDRVDWLGANNTGSTKYSAVWVFGKMDKTIVYSSLQAVKDYSLGNTPYYLTNRQYSDSVDNSFNVSGEYIQNNGGTFAYEQIREQINNSNVTNDSSVSNIVNDYSQTIINNYNYTTPDSGEGGDSGEGDNKDEEGGNGLLDLLGGLGDLLDFIMSLLGQVISIIAGFLNALLDILRSLGGIFSGFSGLLGELFSFIPTELITLLTASIEAVILIAVWKMIKK